MIPNGTLLHSYHADHQLFTISIRDFLALPVKNWKYNRAPDKIRCKEIAAHIMRSKQPVETVFYLVRVNHGYEILDGIHRYTALKMLSEEPVDYITYSTDWLMASAVLINVRFDATEGQCIDVFKALNKSVPVPELYMRDPNQVRKETVERVVAAWVRMYPDHFSASRKPQRPNINRDTFTEVVDAVYDILGDMPTVEEIEARLMERNQVGRERYEEETVKSVEKCRRTGCWLFMLTTDQIME